MGVARSSVRRIAWTTAAVVVGVITLGLTPAVAVAAPPDTGSNITPAERDEILAQHALFRAEVGEPSLVWDNTIATGAQEWADAKQADGQFEHSSGTGLGENLAGGEVKDATMRLGTDQRINYQSDPQPTGQRKKPWATTPRSSGARRRESAAGSPLPRPRPARRRPGTHRTSPPRRRGRAFLRVGALVAVEHDVIRLVPHVTAAHLAERGVPLRRHEVPLDLPTAAVELRWHRRVDDDPASRWLRHRLRDSIKPLTAGPSR
jgi:hypothetical protein